MFLASQRIKYDETVKEEREKELRLHELRTLPSCGPSQCWQPIPGILSKQGVSMVQGKSLADVESELRRLGNPLKKTAEPSQFPCMTPFQSAGGDSVQVGCLPEKNWSMQHFPECELRAIDSRTTHPACSYREMGVDRFDPICRDPQNLSYIEHPGEINIQYRMVVKDNHRPCVPQLIDPTPLLPTGGDLDLEPLCPERPDIKGTFLGNLRPQRWTSDMDAAFGRK